ncbi:hypothetical protein WJT74_11240 [Sphingomicrobium sp. XHP0239]|uniref:hypothetical protein n=1 Tax=Sphingomicrobium maritimum TaxID=3133972 RepID=UPI0031CCC9D2
MERTEADTALAAVRASDRWLAERGWPFSRHAMFGLFEGAIVASWAIPQPWAGFVVVASLGGLFAVVKGDRDRDGFFVNGWSCEAARPATLLAVVAVLAGFVAMILTGPIFEWRPEGLAIGAAVALVCTGASLWWQQLWRRELLEDTHG